jgi:uncharacterized membrane protein YeaQ/YmgE (transglycosylase-associated protein family)
MRRLYRRAAYVATLRGGGARDWGNAMLEQIQPYTPLIIMVVTGLIAGWIVGMLFGGGGLVRNLFVGIIGALLGGALVRYNLLQLPAAVTNVTNIVPYGTQIVISTIGAAIVVVLARLVGGRA